MKVVVFLQISKRTCCFIPTVWGWKLQKENRPVESNYKVSNFDSCFLFSGMIRF